MSVPKLRFTEFNLPYKLTELGDALIGYSLGGNYANSCDVTSNPLIKMGNLGRGYINTEKVEYIQNNEMITDDNKLEIGDLLFNTRNTLDLVGKVAIWRGELERAYFNSNIMRMVFDNNYYMNYALNTKKSLTKLKAIASGTTSVAAIYTKDLKKIKIWIPSIKEQTKISDFLSSVDDKITLLNKQYDLLCRYKKEMLQKVFSQVLRFKDESGEEFPEWEPKQLSDIAMINPKNKELPSEFIYIDLESVEKGQLLKEQLIRKNDAPSRAQRLLSPGDVLFQLVRPYQKNNYIFFLSGNYVASTGYAQLRANYNPHFLYQLLHLESFTSEVMNRCTGTSYPAINSSDLASIEIEIPSEKEQIKIASFLSAIDDKIAIKKAELDRLKNWKQGLLQQMFV